MAPMTFFANGITAIFRVTKARPSRVAPRISPEKRLKLEKLAHKAKELAEVQISEDFFALDGYVSQAVMTSLNLDRKINEYLNAKVRLERSLLTIYS